MKKIVLLVIFLIGFVPLMVSQSKCKVKIKSISTTYEGNCRKGYAHGQGEAKGDEDSYKGTFKKGIPHGYGTYKWGNGNIYVGEFSKGKMDGKGQLTLKDSLKGTKVQKGFFNKGTYIGEYKNPYAIISKRETKSVFIREDPSIITLPDIYIIKISFMFQGRQIIPNQVNVFDDGKSVIEQQGSFIVMKNVKFPSKKIEISFRTNQGFNGLVKLDIYKKANWLVEIRI